MAAIDAAVTTAPAAALARLPAPQQDPIARSLGAGGPGFDLSRIPALPQLDVTGGAPLAQELGRAPVDPQLRPAIGEADDHLEQEADRIAAHTLGLSGPPIESAPPEAARAINEPPARELDDAPVDEAQLTHGGRPLPRSLRGFFEDRLGVDLGHVRVHQGADAEALNRDVAARALTYGSHVWLGRGEPVAPTFTLAHELTHVVQQTQPRGARTEAISRAAASIQRAIIAPYWAPSTRKGRVKHGHDDIVKALGKGIFNEVPVPLATGRAAGVSSKKSVGWADLYAADKAGAVGLSFFDDHGTITPFSIEDHDGPTKRTLKNQSGFAPGKKGAPRWNGKKVVAVGDAPSWIAVGDVKPLPWASSFLGSLTKPSLASQLKSYREGFALTAEHVNDFVKAGKATTTSAWSLTERDTRILKDNEVKIPPELDLKTPIKATETLDLWEGSHALAEQPLTPVKGEQRVFTRTPHDGAWHYVWIPEATSLRGAAQAQPEIDRIARMIQDQLVRAIEAVPAVTKGPVAGKPRALHRLRRDAARRVRRRAPPDKDTFDLDAWKLKYNDLKTKQKDVAKTKPWKDAKGQQKAHEAHVKLQGLLPSIGAPPQQLVDTAKSVGKIEFWLSWKGRVLARLRKAFGKIFIKLAQGFHAIKVKVTEFFKANPEPSTSGADRWWSRVIKICWKIIRYAAPRLLASVVNTLWDALAAGVTKKVKQYIPIDEVEDKLRDEAAALAKKLGIDSREDLDEDTIVDAVVAKVAAAIGFEDEIKLFQEIADVARVLATLGELVSWVKWILRITAAGSQCAWPPGLGCLKILAVPLVEYTAFKIFERVSKECWFQQHVASYVQDIDLLRSFGRRIGVALIKKIRDVSPEVGDLFDTSAVEHVRMQGYDECDRANDKYTPTPGQLELADFATAMGGSGLQALMELEEDLTNPNGDPARDSASKIKKLVEGQGTDPDGPERDRPRAKEAERPGGAPKQRDHGKPDVGGDVEQAAEKGDAGNQGAPTKPNPKGDPKITDRGDMTPGDETSKPTPEPITPPTPGDSPGTDDPRGKARPGAGKQQRKGPGPAGTSPGQSEDKRGRARDMLGRLRKLRDALQRQAPGKTGSSGGAAKPTDGGGGAAKPTDGGGGAGARPKPPQAPPQGPAGGARKKDAEPDDGGAAPAPDRKRDGGDDGEIAAKPKRPPAQPDPMQPDAAAAAAKRTQALIDLIDALIRLLEKIERGELDDNDAIEAAILILVENAKNGVSLDPNATKTIYVFRFLGWKVGEAITGRPPVDKSSPDTRAADPSQGKGDGEGDGKGGAPPTGGVDDLQGDPLDGRPAEGKGAPPPEGRPPEAEPEGEPPEAKPPEAKPPGRDPGEGQPPPRPPSGPDLDPGQTPDAGEGPGAPAPPPAAAEFAFDPIRDNAAIDPVITGYYVTPIDRAKLQLRGDEIINRKPSIVARVKLGTSGEVTLISGVLIAYLTRIVRALPPPDTWTGSGRPVFKLNFYQAPRATDDEPPP